VNGPDGDGGRWRVARIETAPMTAQQHRAAVAALAALIAGWQARRATDGRSEDKSDPPR